MVASSSSRSGARMSVRPKPRRALVERPFGTARWRETNARHPLAAGEGSKEEGMRSTRQRCGAGTIGVVSGDGAGRLPPPSRHSGERACEEISVNSLEPQRTRTHQPPLIPAHAGIQLSPLNRKRLKKLDSRVRGNERVGMFAFCRLGRRSVGHPFAGPNPGVLHSLESRNPSLSATSSCHAGFHAGYGPRLSSG